MTIGNALFGKLAIEGFGKLSSQISGLQARIASGTNDPRPSADPMRAVQLSAATETKASIAQFSANATRAADRLALSDLALGDLSASLRRLNEIALAAASDTMTAEGFAGLRSEAISLRQSLLDAANVTDAAGQPLFSGYADSIPFADTAAGVAYLGDTGRPALRLGETTTLRTGLNGADAFMAVPTATGSRSLFDIADDLIATLSPSLQTARPSQTVANAALFSPQAGRDAATLSFTVTGPLGAATLSAQVMQGAPGPLADAINAASVSTGITARLADDGESVILHAQGDITLSDLAQAESPRVAIAWLTPLDAADAPTGPRLGLRPASLSADQTIANLGSALSRMAANRAEVGALATAADDRAQALADRKLQIDQAIAGLQDLDVAAAVTRLQTLLLGEQAAQQSFVKISGTSLFDYL
jgi:flagellar hook-associated protein 3 FlgL